MTASLLDEEFTWPSLFDQTLEDQFALAKIEQEINNATSLDQLKNGALMLARLASMRQGVIRSLVKQLAGLQEQEIKEKYNKRMEELEST